MASIHHHSQWVKIINFVSFLVILGDLYTLLSKLKWWICFKDHQNCFVFQDNDYFLTFWAAIFGVSSDKEEDVENAIKRAWLWPIKHSNIHIGNDYLTPGNVFPNKHSVSNFWLWSCLAVDSSIGHATFAQIMKIIFGIFLEVLAFLKAVQNHTWNCNLEQSLFWSCHCVWRALSHKTLCLFERRNMTTSSQHANHVLQYQCCA